MNKVTYGVDMVFCIDATGTMGPVLDLVKENAIHFYQDFIGVMQSKQKSVEQLRVRIVAFRDYFYDEGNAMMVTDFFHLPYQAAEFERAIRSIQPFGGGDEPEDGLEGLAYAMRSNWSRNTSKRRHVIVVWSDASTHNLGFGKHKTYQGHSPNPYYPSGMPVDFNELTMWWGNTYAPGVMEEEAKRMVIFAPDKPGWSDISNNWNKVFHFPSVAGTGLKEMGYEQILSTISNTI